MRPRQALYQMISDVDCGLACARAVMAYQEEIEEPWTCDEEAARKRLMQCLNGTAGRHFEVDWFPVVLDVVLKHGGSDLVEPILAETRYQARRASEQPVIHRARPRSTAQSGAA